MIEIDRCNDLSGSYMVKIDLTAIFGIGYGIISLILIDNYYTSHPLVRGLM